MELFRKRNLQTEHQYVEERLSAYLDGQLSSRELAAVDRHLKSCAHCRWNLDTLRQTVQLTRSLPTVAVPRVFTVPVPAKAERARQRPWGLPVLQGATVLVAVLFFFVVASEFALTGLLPASAPEPVAMLEQAPVATQLSEPVAEVVEKAAVPDAAAESAADAVAEAVTEAATAATEGLAPEAATDAEEAEAEEAASVWEETAASPEPDAGAMSGVKFPSSGAEGENAEGTPEEAPRASLQTATVTVQPTLAPTFTSAPADVEPESGVAESADTDAPVSSSDVSEPDVSESDVSDDVAATVVAEIQKPVPAGLQQGATQSPQASRDTVFGWLGMAELVLGIAFIVLGIATILVMYRLRRAR